MAIKVEKPLEVFFSYAHEDEALRDELAKHLSLLKRQGVISEWHDREITAGSQWKDQIDGHLESASIILLLVSADFLNSDYCYDIEMNRALERDARGEACVIPIILRPVDWQGAPFGRLQCLPKDAEPVTSWPNRDEAFLDIAKGIRKAALAMNNATSRHSGMDCRYPERREVVVGAGSEPAPACPSPICPPWQLGSGIPCRNDGENLKPGIPTQAESEPPKSIAMRLWAWLTETNMKKLGFIGTLIAVLAGAGWTVYIHNPPLDDSGLLVAAGDDMLNIGRYPEAKDIFKDALKSNPQNEEAAWGLKKAQVWDASNTPVFEAAIKRLYQEDPDDGHVNLFLGQLYAVEPTPENHDKAIRYLQQAIILNPKLAEAYFDLGVLHEQSGNDQEAESNYRQAIAISQTTPKYLNNLAYLYFKQKNYPKALAEYGKVSQFPLSALESAKIYWRLGKFEQARDNQRLALQWLGDDKLMANAEQQQPWDFKIGNEGMEQIAGLAEKKSYAYFCLSVSQYLSGQTKEAMATVNTMRELKLPRQSTIDAIVRDDLEKLKQDNSALAVPVDAYEKRYLQ
ncbi:MAG: TIR domain-containing protein [Candidatus Methylumidiphilus sp.]